MQKGKRYIDEQRLARLLDQARAQGRADLAHELAGQAGPLLYRGLVNLHQWLDGIAVGYAMVDGGDCHKSAHWAADVQAAMDLLNAIEAGKGELPI